MKHYFVLILFSLCLTTCREHPTQPIQLAAQLTVLDASCIEAWIKISAPSQPETVSLLRNDSTVLTVALAQQDTIVVDRNLLPTHTYTYKTRVLATGVTSEGVKATTMDTTSNNFTFEIDTLSTLITSSSFLTDIAIINDTLAYAVGNIAATDSAGNATPYDMGVWNGTKWQLKQHYYQENLVIAPVRGICVNNTSDIWLSAGSVFHWDGVSSLTPLSFSRLTLPDPNAFIEKILEPSSNLVYGVGDVGTIVLFNGTSWHEIQSGTSMGLTDIYGSSGRVLVAGTNDEYAQGIILNLSGSTCTTLEESDFITADQLFKPKLYGDIVTVWIDEKNAIYAGGNLLFWNKYNQWDYVRSLPENYLGGNHNVFYRGFIGKVRGNASNDLWISGDRNTLRHFNGATWTQVGLPYDPNSAIAWPGLAVRGNLCIGTGENGRLAIAIVIRRK